MMQDNTVDLKMKLNDFKDKRFKFMVSSRNLQYGMDIIKYLKLTYIYLELDQIDCVFGHTDFPSRLYGGRPIRHDYALTEVQVERLAENRISISLTLSNHYFDQTSYEETRPLLRRYHKRGNSIVCTNDELACRIKDEFPDYELKASVIKNINTLEKVTEALQLYDKITIPMDKNDDSDFLQAMPSKERIILFANGTCAYTCPDRTCYEGISQQIAGKAVRSGCSKQRVPRQDRGTVFFDIQKFGTMGYSYFKLIPRIS